MAILKGCGIGHPPQNNIPIEAITAHFGNVVWLNWNSNRKSVARKLRHLWRPVPSSAEWEAAAADARKYWQQSNHEWWKMPIYSIPVMYNEPEGQGKTLPADAAAVMRKWADDTDGAPFIGFKNLHNEVAGGVAWRRAYATAGGPVPTIEAFDVFGYSGGDIVRYAADCVNAVRSGYFGGDPDRRVWFLEVGGWGQVGQWEPTPETLAGVMDAAAYLSTVPEIDLVCWFSTFYGQESGFWMQNNLVDSDGAQLTALGERWRGYVAGTRPISQAYAQLWRQRRAQAQVPGAGG